MGEDIVGWRFAFLTVIANSGRRNKRNRVIWVVRCDCGNEMEVLRNSLSVGQNMSCGCHDDEDLDPVNYALRGRYYAHTSWRSMRGRVKNVSNYKRNLGYADVTIDPAWDDCEVFFAQMGPRRKEESLDRIDPWGGYYGFNARWATKTEQAANRRNSKKKAA